MDLLLLGAMAVVLIALTLWLVWHPSPETARPEANQPMTPMGDQFEDQYTSATADLSAGGVAVTTAHSEGPAEQSATTWPEATIGPEGSATGIEGTRPRTPPASTTQRTPAASATPRTPVVSTTARTEPAAQPARSATPRTIGMGAAAALTLGGAAAGAWLYARWQRERNKPLSRLRRRFR